MKKIMAMVLIALFVLSSTSQAMAAVEYYGDFGMYEEGMEISYFYYYDELGNVDGKLESGFNRTRDVMLNIKVQMTELGVYDGNMIAKLLNLTNSYNNNKVKYTLIPNKSGEHKSNSFARGLLNAAGIYPNQPAYSVPGWQYPLPKSLF